MRLSFKAIFSLKEIGWLACYVTLHYPKAQTAVSEFYFHIFKKEGKEHNRLKFFCLSIPFHLFKKPVNGLH